MGDVEEVIFEVSILVLMDESFRQCPKTAQPSISVSILVLMDESFRLPVYAKDFEPIAFPSLF